MVVNQQHLSLDNMGGIDNLGVTESSFSEIAGLHPAPISQSGGGKRRWKSKKRRIRRSKGRRTKYNKKRSLKSKRGSKKRSRRR